MSGGYPHQKTQQCYLGSCCMRPPKDWAQLCGQWTYQSYVCNGTLIKSLNTKAWVYFPCCQYSMYIVTHWCQESNVSWCPRGRTMEAPCLALPWTPSYVLLPLSGFHLYPFCKIICNMNMTAFSEFWFLESLQICEWLWGPHRPAAGITSKGRPLCTICPLIFPLANILTKSLSWLFFKNTHMCTYIFFDYFMGVEFMGTGTNFTFYCTHFHTVLSFSKYTLPLK